MTLKETLTRPAYSLEQLLELVPLGRTSIYEEIRNKRLRPTKRGSRTIFLVGDVAAWLTALRNDTSTDKAA